MNKVILMGNLVADPELKTTQNGKSIGEFRVAVRRARKNPQGEYESDFLRCRCFGATAEFVSKFFTKGRRILVEGSIQTSSWDKEDGTKGFSTDIIVDSVEFVDKASDNDAPQPVAKGKGAIPSNYTPVASSDDLPF